MPFICIIDTVFDGRVASWMDENERPIVYDTEQEANLDAFDPEMLEADNEPDSVIEVVVTPEKIYDPVDGRVYWERGGGILPRSTFQCPDCKTQLHFELFGQMRVRRQSEDVAIYKARCPSCGTRHRVMADKEKE